MTIKLEHLGQDAAGSVVVHGVDTVDAVTHLCHALVHGGGPIEPIVVLDLTNAPLTAQAALAELRRTADTLARSRRWLGVVEPWHARAAQGEDGWYGTPAAALAAGRRYAALVTGRSTSHVSTIGAAVAGTIAWTPELLGAVAVRGWSLLRSCAGALRSGTGAVGRRFLD
ncbi:MAG TPA: hypothetical protein VG650_01765 [Mycobacteriales bacterium]|nr:hypothetical protein [Mycobacteriales bacterium]